MKGEKEIVFVPDVPGFVLQLASRFASQPLCPSKASIVKQTMDAYTGFVHFLLFDSAFFDAS
jgi:hypothetical protein